ncbi:MAG: CHAT domain-containing protein [Waterburya sp.]
MAAIDMSMPSSSDASGTPLPAAALSLDFQCFHCGRKLQATIPQIIDLQIKPELRRAVVQNTVHDFSCPQCETISRFAVPFIVWDPAQQKVFAFHENSQPSDEIGHFEQLFKRLQVVQPAAANAQLVHCQTKGELLESLLTFHWHDPEPMGLTLSGIWKQLFPRFSPTVRTQLLDLLAEGDQPRMLAGIEADNDLFLAICEAMDPEESMYTPAIKSALRMLNDVNTHTPENLINTVLQGLVDCTKNAEQTAGIRQKLLAGIAVGANKVPLAKDDKSLQFWQSWPHKLPPELPAEDRCIVLFNLAGSAFDRLDLATEAPLIAPIRHLFLSSLGEGAPPKLAAMAHQRIAQLCFEQTPADLGGTYHAQQAAIGFEALNEPREALLIWRQLMHWLAALGHGTDAVSAGARGYQLAVQLDSELFLSFARDLIRVAWFSPGEDRNERLEVAIAISRALVEYHDSMGSPDGQVHERINLANVLLDQGGGDDVARVEEAISTLLAVQDKPILAQDPVLAKLWLSALALAYKRRSVGDPDDNLEQAIGCYRRALTLLIEPSSPALQNDERDVVDGTIVYNLANSLLRQKRGRRNNLVEALKLHQALRSSRQLSQSHLQLQARSWFSIGNVHYEWAILGSPPHARHLLKAINAYSKAQQFLNPQKQPDDMARCLQAEASALTLLPNNSARLETILDRYKQAISLAAGTGDVSLQEDLAAGKGGVLFHNHRMVEATQVYTEALRLRCQLIAEVVSGITRASLLSPMATYAARLAYALIHGGQTEAGINALLKARVIDLNAALTGVQSNSPEAQRYRAARALMLKLEAEEAKHKVSLSAQTDQTLHSFHQKLSDARADLDTATAALNPEATASIAAILAAQADENTLIAFPILTTLGSVIVYRLGRQDATVPFQTKFLNQVDIGEVRCLLIGEGDRTQTELEGWLTIVSALAKVKSQADMQAIALRMTQFFQQLGKSPLMQGLRELIAETHVKELRLLSHGGLQTLPVTMGIDPQTEAPLLSQVSVSSQIGLAPPSIVTPTKEKAKRVLIVANPQADLPFSKWEAALISAQLESASSMETPIEIDILQGKEATRQTLLERVGWADILHFAGHAKHQWNQATQSALICADGKLSVQDLRLVTQLAPLQLVVLSACESGITAISHLPDEFIGLPASFFALGAEAVISTMWSVPDEAPAILMAEFYRNVFEMKMSWSHALTAAQRHLARSTAGELQLALKLEQLYELGCRQEASLGRRALFYKRHPTAKPFVHPIFWGAYTCQYR